MFCFTQDNNGFASSERYSSTPVTDCPAVLLCCCTQQDDNGAGSGSGKKYPTKKHTTKKYSTKKHTTKKYGKKGGNGGSSSGGSNGGHGGKDDKDDKDEEESGEVSQDVLCNLLSCCFFTFFHAILLGIDHLHVCMLASTQHVPASGMP
jgi:hypothetical protein